MIELNKIYNENCLETMKKIPDNFVDLIVTSPPYDKLRDYNGYDFDFENIAKEMFRIVKDGGVVVWVVKDSVIEGSKSLNSFKQAIYFNEIGFRIYDVMIYAKNGVNFPTPNRYYDCFEYMFILSKSKPKSINLIKDRKNNYVGKKSSKSSTARQKNGNKKSRSESFYNPVNEYGIRWNIWDYNTGFMHSSKDKEAFDHPAIFPENLCQDHIISWSNENDIIYDPFMGSGTTAKMAIINNRNYIGSEISEEYCKIIYDRIEIAKNIYSKKEKIDETSNNLKKFLRQSKDNDEDVKDF